MDLLLNDKTNKLVVNGLHKSYGAKTVLQDATFTVKDGEFLSILGPSGCGKTTILRILIGLLAPDGGQIFKDGVEITNARPDERGMGIVFQNYALFENMTVLQNVAYPIRIKLKDKAAAKQTAMELLELVGLAEHADKRPAGLSGGQQQRVAIARTLALRPDVILFDEPMSALDVETRLTMRRELKEIQKNFGTTMIYITHDQEEAFAMSDRIMVMSESIIKQLDTPEEILRNPADDYVKRFVLENLQIKIDSLAKYATRSN